MNFDFKEGLIWVSLQLNYEDNEMLIDNCILDTGSATTAIDIDLVDFNYSKPAIIKRLFGIGGGSQEVVSQKVEKVALGGEIINDIEIEFGDLQAELGINGFVGNDLLSRFRMTIDYKNCEIRLTKPLAD